MMDTDEPEVGYKWESSYAEGLNFLINMFKIYQYFL